jgi:hypothetical protein
MIMITLTRVAPADNEVIKCEDEHFAVIRSAVTCGAG